MVENASKTMHISGQLGISSKTGKLVDGGLEHEFEQIVANVKAILDQANASLT